MRFTLALLFFSLFVVDASAQRAMRIGVGFDAMLGLPSQDVVPEGLGIGVRGRILAIAAD